MFDFLKKLFGKKPEPTEEKTNKGSSVQIADEIRKTSDKKTSAGYSTVTEHIEEVLNGSAGKFAEQVLINRGMNKNKPGYDDLKKEEIVCDNHRREMAVPSSDISDSTVASQQVFEDDADKIRPRYVSPAYKRLKKEAVDQLVVTLEQTINQQTEAVVELKKLEQQTIRESVVQKKESISAKSTTSNPAISKYTEPSPLKASVSKVGVPPVQTKARPQVVAPRTQPGRVAPSAGKRVQKTSVYIGLDFGTTFTKAAYEIAPSNVHIKYSIRFGQCDKNEDYYLPSVLYFDPKMQKLKIFDPDENCEEIRYFKYNMISDALKKNEVLNDSSVATESVKEELCSVFFLSYVIYLIRNAVYQNFSNTKDAENTVWYINMGVPLEAHKDDKRALVYKHVLEVAYLLEQKYHGKTEIDIHELDAFYVEHSKESNPNINILPEIYAEVLLYQQYLNTPAGFYTVVDIGGGTEDIATFLKMSGRFGEQVDCLAQNVIGYGYDSLSEKIVKNIDTESTQKAKALLTRTVDFNNDENLQFKVPREVSFEKLKDARRECRTLFGTCVQKARKKRTEVLQQTVDARLPMHVFVMGGARSVEFYRASIEYMKKAQGNAGIPFFKDSDIFDYVGKNTRLEIRNDQRLVISQMLAQPFEMIPEITNMPWNLKDKDVTSKGKHWTELQELQNELYPD